MGLQRVWHAAGGLWWVPPMEDTGSTPPCLHGWVKPHAWLQGCLETTWSAKQAPFPLPSWARGRRAAFWYPSRLPRADAVWTRDGHVLGTTFAHQHDRTVRVLCRKRSLAKGCLICAGKKWKISVPSENRREGGTWATWKHKIPEIVWTGN